MSNGNNISRPIAFNVDVSDDVALAEGGRAGEIRFLGEVENTPATIERMIKKLTIF